MTYTKFPEWVRCPECGSEEVDVTGRGGETGFHCTECGRHDDPSIGEHVDE